MEATDNKNDVISSSIITVDEVNTDILPIIYEIIRGIEKEHHDNAIKVRETQECSNKVLELKKRLDQVRSEIRRLPGIEFSKEQQLNNLENLKTQLKLKQELLQKYRFLAFDINKS